MAKKDSGNIGVVVVVGLFALGVGYFLYKRLPKSKTKFRTMTRDPKTGKYVVTGGTSQKQSFKGSKSVVSSINTGERTYNPEATYSPPKPSENSNPVAIPGNIGTMTFQNLPPKRELTPRELNIILS